MKKPQKRPAVRKKTAKKTSKRSKNASDAFKALKLVIVLIITSICISFAVITVYSNSARTDRGKAGAAETPLEQTAVAQSAPEITVSIDGLPASGATQGNTRTEAVAPATVREISPSPAPAPAAAAETTNTNPAPARVTTTPVSAVKPVDNMGVIAFVIDDAGNNLKELEPFLRVPGPLTIAVLPGLPHSAEAARRIRAAGKEVILHQPMEAVGGQDPGPGAIYSGMGEEEIRSILARNIAEVGPVAGMNNHQGSKITMDREVMEVILSFCAENNLYFLDSRTTAETAAPAAARRLGIKIAERDVFLDNEQNKEAILRYLNSGLARVQRNGKAVMIGHTWSPELAPLLAEQFPILTIQGYTIKNAGDILGLR